MDIARAKSPWSKSALAEEFELDRRTVSKLLEGVPPAGTYRGQPVYRIAEAAPALVSARTGKSGSTGLSIDGVDWSQVDPATMHPKDKKDWMHAEQARLSIELQTGKLAEAEDVRDLLGEIFKQVRAFVGTLPDDLDRLSGIGRDAAARVDAAGDKLLLQLHASLTKSGLAGDRAADPDAEDDDGVR